MANTRLFSSILFSVLLVTYPVAAEDAARVLTVTGEGSVATAPDMATIHLGVQREARDAGAAMAAASEAAAGVLASLEASGVAASDIQTTRIGLDPRYARQSDNSPPRITGYIASNDLVVRVRDLERLGAILDDLISEGANAFRGIGFGISDTTELANAARVAAVEDAVARAETLAGAAGLTLGPILSLSEGGGGGIPQPLMRSAMMAEAAMPVAEGEVEVSARVTLVYKIAD